MHISDHIKKILVFGIIVLFIGASIVPGMSKNTQRTDNIPNNETTETRGLSSEDIAALQKQAETEGWTFTVGENSATKRPLDELCGLVEPKEWWVDARFDPCTSAGDLPSTFDWRTLGGCTPIKDQGSCGSCWAFATVGSLECNIKIRDGITVDLSEQWLVDCNSNSWSCNGGWFAHDYHMWKADFCGDTGAVLEQNCPYLERDSICRCPYQHDYLIDYWAYIGSSYGIPSASDIKQAIMTYGPVSVAVYISPAFRAYSGGVFNSHSSGSINHCVVLVGWDDTQGTEGVWFLRNSWGTDWGEDGYMRIGYDCCSVGYAACYVDYPGSVTGQPPVAEFIYAPANPTGTSIIQFNDTSLDPDGAIVSWWWDFGDHYYSDLQNPIHCYYVENDYTVSLTVTDDQGLTDTLTRQILMTGEPPANTPPTADFTWSPQSPTIEDIIQFIDLSIDNDGVIVYWTWEFGDGTISHYQNPTHQYTDGTYTLNLTVESVAPSSSSTVRFNVYVPSVY